MRIVLIGDIHLFQLRVKPRDLLGKRILGQGNLWLNRSRRFNHALLAPLFERVKELGPDLVLCSGDVTTTSLENEFLDIMEHFRPLAREVPVVVVPGNHDKYTFRSHQKRTMHTLMEGLMPDEFPHVRDLGGGWNLMGLDSARPQVMMSRGALGSKQVAGIERCLAELSDGGKEGGAEGGREGGLIVLCHYPSVMPRGMPRSWAHDLKEARWLTKRLSEYPGRVVFVHGHIHKPWYHRAQENGKPPFDILNAGAPCMTSSRFPLGQGFWEITLPEDPRGELGLVRHVPEAPEGEPSRTRGRRRGVLRRRKRIYAEAVWRREQIHGDDDEAVG